MNFRVGLGGNRIGFGLYQTGPTNPDFWTKKTQIKNELKFMCLSLRFSGRTRTSIYIFRPTRFVLGLYQVIPFWPELKTDSNLYTRALHFLDFFGPIRQTQPILSALQNITNHFKLVMSRRLKLGSYIYYNLSIVYIIESVWIIFFINTVIKRNIKTILL